MEIVNRTTDASGSPVDIIEEFEEAKQARYIRLEINMSQSLSFNVNNLKVFYDPSIGSTEPGDEPPVIDREINYALGGTAVASSGTASRAIDNDATTVWQPSSADRADMNVWLTVDLGERVSFNKVSWFFNRTDIFENYRILLSDDNVDWSELLVSTTVSSTGVSETLETPVSTRYIKLDITLSNNLSVTVNNFSVILDPFITEPVPADLASIYFGDNQDTPYPASTTADLQMGETLKLNLIGVSDTGAQIDMKYIRKTLTSSTDAASVSSDGVVTPVKAGAARISAEVTKNDGTVLRTGDYWIIVKDPEEFRSATYIAASSLEHSTRQMVSLFAAKATTGKERCSTVPEMLREICFKSEIIGE